jgi:competence protein ComEC
MLRAATAAILAGVLILHNLPVLPPGWLLYTAPVVLVSLLLSKSRLIKILLFFLAGFLWAHFQANLLVKHRLPDNYISRDITVSGHIASLPKHNSRRIQFEFDVDRVAAPEIEIAPTKIRLAWYHKYASSRLPTLKVGDKWQFTVRLKPPRNYANPGSFDYSGWLLQKKILSTGYITGHSKKMLLESDPYAYPVQRVRQQIRTKLSALNLDPHIEPFLRALIIGDRANLDSSDWLVLKNTGTVHLMAISGLHVGLIAGFVFLIARLAWSVFPFLTLRFAAPRAAAIMAWAAASVYAALAGFSLPTQRALIMLSIILLSVVLNKIPRPLTVLCFALLVILLLDSFAVLSASFWLSFVAVALIYYFIYVDQNNQRKIKKWIHLQLFLSLGLLPLTALFFQQASIVSPLANLVAIPLVGFVVVPLCFIATSFLFINVPLADELFALASQVFDILWRILVWFSELPDSHIVFSTPSLLIVIVAGIGSLLLFLPRAFKIRSLAMICIIPILFPAHSMPANGEVKVTLLDVGQGLATVIQTRHHAMVFDSGPRFNRYFDTGRAVVLPFLREEGISQLDMLLISHSDNDHIGGAESILAAMPVKTVLSSVPHKLSEYHASRCERGQHWQWDGVQFEVLHPDKNDYATGNYSENNLSCVLKIIAEGRSFLLTADIENEAELLLLSRYSKRLASDVLVVPHHGSKTSSSVPFINTVNPDIVIIPVGWHNRYHFPHKSILRRYTQRNNRVLTTSEQGAISINSEKREISSFRSQIRHYWEH